MFKKLLTISGLILIALNIAVTSWFIYKGHYDRLDALIAWFTFGFFYVNMLDDMD